MTISQRLLGEFLGTMGLLVVVVGSGIMGDALSQGNAALALLANSLATAAGLYALIQCFGPISGAHFNPVVSLLEFLKKQMQGRIFFLYVICQTLGAIGGVFLAHIMFGEEILQLSTRSRGEMRFFVSEIVATFGLIVVVFLTGKNDSRVTPQSVALYICAAYWCTSSTSFANPAVTIARALTDTFAGILWTGVPFFVFAQLIGAFLGAWILSRLKAF